MDELFLEKVDIEKQNIKEYKKWEQKVNSFFIGFDYLNNNQMIEDHIKKLTHIGISSLTESEQLIKNLTTSNLDLIENVLKVITDDIKTLADGFKKIQEGLNAKPSFFSRKSKDEIFLDIFNEEKDKLEDISNKLKVKQEKLNQAKEDSEKNISLVIRQFILLDRDNSIIKKSKAEIKENIKFKNIYKTYEFEINQIQTNLLTQQEIIFQKYAALRIMQENILNCYHNINHITRITNSCMLNMVETHQIISLNKDNEYNSSAIDKIKDNVYNIVSDLKELSVNPFNKVITIKDKSNTNTNRI